MPGVEGAPGEGAPISDKAKGWPVFGEKSEDGEVPEARARQPARPRWGRRSAPGKAVREGDGSEMGGQRVRR